MNNGRLGDLMFKQHPSMPKLLTASEVAPILYSSFINLEWQTPDVGLKEEERPKFEAVAKSRRNEESLSTAEVDVERLLEATIASEQIDWAIEKAFTKFSTRFIESSLGRKIVKRQRELMGKPRKGSLNVQVSIILHSVTIPDHSKDEIQLDLKLMSGGKVEDLLQFMSDNGLVPDTEIGPSGKRWVGSEASIGITESERTVLDKCLNLRFRDTLSREDRYVNFNYGPSSHLIWRESESIITVRAQLDTANYPFDETLIPLCLEGAWSQTFDPSIQQFVPDTAPGTHTADCTRAVPPRGFDFTWQSCSLEAAVYSPRVDLLPVSSLLLGFVLHRRTDSAVWRTFIPTLVVVSVALFGTILSLWSGQFLDSVMTQVLPAVLIACVALQWTAAQNIPPSSGRTLVDRLFVSIYFTLLFLFLALSLGVISRLFSLLFLVLALGVFLYGVNFILQWYIKASAARKK